MRVVTLSFLTLILSFFTAACCNTSKPVYPAKARVTIEQSLALSGYTAAELCCVETKTEVSDFTLNTLFRALRSGLINSDVFDTVNGLHRYPSLPKSNHKTVRIVPILTTFLPKDCFATLEVSFIFTDKATDDTLGRLSICACGGEIGINAAIQRMALSLEEVLQCNTGN